MGINGKTAAAAVLKSRGSSLLLGLMLWSAATIHPMDVAAQAKLSQSDLYCAGYYTHRPIESSLTVLGSEDGGFKNEFSTGDYVYLSQGRAVAGAPGQQFAVIRPVRDVNRQEAFNGQRRLLAGLGTLYAEVGRIEVSVVHEQSATAKVLMACDAIEPGDILVPFAPRTAPAFKSPHMTDRFAPSSGKATGLIAGARDFDVWLGEGKVVYLNLGRAHGLQPGSYLRVVRDYLGGGNVTFAAASRQLPVDVESVGGGQRLTEEQEAAMPRETLGEVMILSVEDGSSTGIITYSRAEIGVGDTVEVE